MSPEKTKPTAHNAPADTTRVVDDFMQALDHPFKNEIETIRQIILSSHSSVAEGIKWNAPSFRTTEYFATINFRAKGSIYVILHLGAKVRETAITGVVIRDQGNLLKWLAKDRASVIFTDAKDISKKKAAFKNVLKQWLVFV